MIDELCNRRLLLLSGKGGVGRTTVAAALAHAAATRGKRVLVAQMDGHERLGPLFGHEAEIGTHITPLAPRIDAVNMTARAALHEYGLLVLRYEALVKAVFENRPVRAFLSAVPGLDAYAMLGKAWYHTTELVQDGNENRPRYDLVIIDGPASGHAATLLRIPRAILATMPRGPLARDARSISELLSDPARSAFVIVTLPEELPVNEAVELAQLARNVIGLALGPIVMNSVPAPDWNHPDLRALFTALPDRTGDPALDATLLGARALGVRRATAERLRAELEARSGCSTLALPQLAGGVRGPAELAALAAALSSASR